MAVFARKSALVNPRVTEEQFSQSKILGRRRISTLQKKDTATSYIGLTSRTEMFKVTAHAG